MARMKDLYTWFCDKYDIFDDEAGEWKQINQLFVIDTPPQKGEGIRIVVKHNGEDPQEYMLDLYKGTDYQPDLTPDEMFKIITKTIDDIMEVMPNE